MYEYGRGVRKSARTAAKWYRKAAAQGELRAIYQLGILHESGRGVPRDYQAAAKWYLKAAAAGDPKAQAKLGILMSEGRWIPKNGVEKKAVKWVRRYLRMELRDLVAEGSIGLQAGLTTASDGISPMATAGQFATLEELAKAAYRRGGRNATAQVNLGFLQYLGIGFPRDYE